MSFSFTEGKYNFLLKYFIYLFQAFDKFYSWFPSFLDIFPDEEITFSQLFNNKKSKKLSRMSKEYYKKPARSWLLCWNGSFPNIASLLLPHRGRITKREERKVATVVALADGWGKKNSNEEDMSMGFF